MLREPGTAGRLALVALGVGLALALLEGAARLVAPQPTGGLPLFVEDIHAGYAMRPHATGHGPRGHSVRINADGLRGAATRPRRAGEYRVLVLGDSFAFGLGVAEEETLPASLQQQLQARLPCRKVVVLNAGLPGANLFQNVQRLAPALQRFAPDLVVLALLENDLHNVDRPDHRARGDGGLAPHEGTYRSAAPINQFAALDGAALWLQLHSTAFRELSWWAMRQRLNIEGQSELHALAAQALQSDALADRLLRGESDPATELRFSAATRLLGEAAAAAYSANAEIMLLTFARPEQLVAPKLRHGNQRVAAAALAHGIETIDASPELAGESELLGLYLFPGDHHPSARGHALTAAVLAEAIQHSSSAACAAD
jgi:lysophospholipase L1-like esterase